MMHMNDRPESPAGVMWSTPPLPAHRGELYDFCPSQSPQGGVCKPAAGQRAATHARLAAFHTLDYFIKSLEGQHARANARR